MKGCIFFIIYVIAGLTPIPLDACEGLQAKLAHYTKLKRQGGSAKQMNRWEAQKKDYAARYRQCLRAEPKIQRATGKKKKNKFSKVEHQQLRRLDPETETAITRKLLTTCNFWIDAYNHNPTPDNQSYRNTACRALDDAVREPPGLIVNPSNRRSLEDCIKPDNLIDDEVRECMSGMREPDQN